MLWLAVASALSGIFDIKYYFHLQVRSTRLTRQPTGTFPFRTARAAYLRPPSGMPFHRTRKRAPETLTFRPTIFPGNPVVLENPSPSLHLPIVQRPFRLRTLDLQRGSSD